MDKRTRKILAGVQNDIIEILMLCNDIAEAKTRLRYMLVAINTLLDESRNKE